MKALFSSGEKSANSREVLTMSVSTGVSSSKQSLCAVLLSVILVAWAFKGNESNRHLNPVYWWLNTRVYCPLRQGRDSLCTLSIFRGHFFLEITFEINHKEYATLVGNWVSF